MTWRTLLLMAAPLGVLACQDGTKDTTADGEGTSGSTATEDDTDVPDASDPYVDAVQASCASGEPGTPELWDSVRLESTVTWTLDFDESAEAAGWVDCAYTRSYTGLQRVDVEHICPHCEVIVEGTATMTEGFADCYEPLFGGTESRTETWGYAGADLFRRSSTQLPLNPEPLATLDSPPGDGSAQPVAWDSEYGVNDEEGNEVGRFVLAASGTVTWTEDASVPIEEPYGPRSAPYACGWECNDPGDLGGSYPLEPGGVVPNFRMLDQCDEQVDLHDFYGSYIVLDSAQSDCGPCLQMAEEAEAFKAQMTEAGIPVRLIPLLGNGLAEVYLSPTEATHDAWVERFEPHDPVLADRGWGYASLGQYLSDHEGTDIAWPAWIVIAPDMTVITGAVGFGSWDTIGTIIEADWADRGETGPL